MSSLKAQLGCWVHERWRAELVVRFPRIARQMGITWSDLCNRHERIERDPKTDGRICHWTDSSRLTVATLFPHLGARLLKHCLKERPIEFAEKREVAPEEHPEVSIIVAIRGTCRLPQLLACLAALRAQRGAAAEIIVVEQSCERELQEFIPDDVHYLHSKTANPDIPFNKCWALNVGAQAARGRVLVILDGDMLVPVSFAVEICQRLCGELEALRFARFIFYLDERSSRAVWSHHTFDTLSTVGQVVENNPTPVAITRDAYLRIGGHDESFYGWGGEDNEFLDRLRSLRVSEGAFLPVVHLWHPESPNRSGDRNIAHLNQRLTISVEERIRQLVGRGFGQEAPAAPWQPTL